MKKTQHHQALQSANPGGRWRPFITPHTHTCTCSRTGFPPDRPPTHLSRYCLKWTQAYSAEWASGPMSSSRQTSPCSRQGAVCLLEGAPSARGSQGRHSRQPRSGLMQGRAGQGTQSAKATPGPLGGATQEAWPPTRGTLTSLQQPAPPPSTLAAGLNRSQVAAPPPAAGPAAPGAPPRRHPHPGCQTRRAAAAPPAARGRPKGSSSLAGGRSRPRAGLTSWHSRVRRQHSPWANPSWLSRLRCILPPPPGPQRLRPCLPPTPVGHPPDWQCCASCAAATNTAWAASVYSPSS